MFSKDDYNGIICSLSDNKTKSFPPEGFSLVISLINLIFFLCMEMKEIILSVYI